MIDSLKAIRDELAEMLGHKGTLNKKGTFSVVGMLLSIVSLIIFVAFLPAINDVIEQALPMLNDMESMIISLFPFVLIIMIFVGMIQYGMPTQRYRR